MQKSPAANRELSCRPREQAQGFDMALHRRTTDSGRTGNLRILERYSLLLSLSQDHPQPRARIESRRTSIEFNLNLTIFLLNQNLLPQLFG
jgi:hypothetical protein